MQVRKSFGWCLVNFVLSSLNFVEDAALEHIADSRPADTADMGSSSRSYIELLCSRHSDRYACAWELYGLSST